MPATLPSYRTPMGFTFAGLRDGEVMSQEQYEALSEEDRAELEEAIREIQKELSTTLKDVPKRQKEHRRQVEDLNYSMATQGVDAAIGDVKAAFADLQPIQDYLDAVRSDLIENAELFLQREDGAEAGPFPVATTEALREAAVPAVCRERHRFQQGDRTAARRSSRKTCRHWPT